MKIVWQKHSKRRLTLQAMMQYSHGAVTPTGLSSTHIDPIQKWCEENDCGVRTSFDMFVFRNKKEMSMFLLKWG